MINDRALWQRARPLFDELVDLEPTARRVHLDAIGASDPALRDAVDSLLAADAGADAALGDYQFGIRRDHTPRLAVSHDPLRIVGHTISHFSVTSYLASGGMGAVYIAEDMALGRTVALKFPLPNQLLHESMRERFVLEARTAAALDHPNLCAVYEIGESEHGVFLAMPLYPGETLNTPLARDGAFLQHDALAIARQVADGLASAHAAGVVHRDLKPGNVMLVADGPVKILDFGLAKIRDVSFTKSNTTLGTIAYIAPEQIRNAAVDARADLWSLGVMLYEMLTGAAPFRGEHDVAVLHAVLHHEPPPVSTLVPKLAPALDALVATLLQKDPAHRYPSAQALSADLAAIANGTPLAFRTSFWNRSALRRRWRTLLVPATALVVVAGGAGWALQTRTTTRQPGTATQSEIVPALQWRNDSAEISTGVELAMALIPDNAGRHLRLRAGVYDIDHLLVVPDSMTIEGAGVMQFDEEQRPSGFTEESRTTLQMITSPGGDMLTLGNGVTLRNIEVVDLAGRSGNVVALSSRRPGDVMTATLVETVIVNPNPLGTDPAGPYGRALLVLTRNRNMGASPMADTGSNLSMHMRSSIIRAPEGGGGFFVFNFAATSTVSLDIAGSVIGGGSEANGGVSRPEVVHDSEAVIESRDNLYRNEWTDPCNSALIGLNLIGGSGAPMVVPLEVSARNTLRVRSTNDRIAGFTTGVFATGSRRFYSDPLHPAPRDNHATVQLIGTTIITPSCARNESRAKISVSPSASPAIADLDLFGAWVDNATLAAGDSNTLRVELRGVTGSGQRPNSYRNSGTASGELPAGLRGRGNRLEIVGSAATFNQSNRGIGRAPAPDLFNTPR